MTRLLLTIAIAVSVQAAAMTAAADPGLSLDWNDCPLSPASQSALIVPCLNSGSEELVASFELAASVDSVIALEAVVDVEAAAATLPPWWQYAPGGCRGGKLISSADFAGKTACADFWQNSATFPVAPGYFTGAPNGGLNQARIVISFGVLSSESRALVAGTRYYAARLIFQNDPVAACPGCDTPVCLLLNSIRLVRIPGTMTGDVDLVVPTAADSNRATWQSLNASCAQVPVRRISWGRIKSLYR